jgi:dolichol-phosphate mannosyltransferase
MSIPSQTPRDQPITQPKGRVGVVIPSYKEAENIQNLLLDVCRHVPQVRIVVVDDSPDLATVQAAQALALPMVNIVHRERKDGRGSAVLAGMKLLLEEGCDQIVEMDSDFSHPPSQIPELLKHASQRQMAMLIASRYLPESRIENWPASRRAFSKFANLVARMVLQVPIADYTNGFRVYARDAAQLVVQTCGRLGRGFIPLSEILVNLYYRGHTIGEIPTVFTNRLRGESSVTFFEIRDAATGLLCIWRLKSILKKQEKRTW